MPDCFISYSHEDEELAKKISETIRGQGLEPFMASMSLRPGQEWSQTIRRNLRNSKWVFVLASPAACQSPFVQQEVGGAIFGEKRIVPVIWNMPPSHLPGWLSRYQALDVRGATLDVLQEKVIRIADEIRAKKAQGLLLLGCLLLALAVFGGKGK
ncbi:MAG: toll/interleukin-1 receptor domain-containing protein [Thermodesulfobacteriota bacterium]